MAKTKVYKYTPDYVSPPGDSLRETIEYLGMSQSALAERTGRPSKTISEIINGKASITQETALQLEKVLGIPASFWMNREMHYREFLARQQEQARLCQQIEWLDNFPVSAMCKKGWIRSFTDKVQQLHEILRFFGVASPEAWDDIWRDAQADFRQSQALKNDPGAVAAWLRKGEIDAQAIHCKPYDQPMFMSVLQQTRALTVESPNVFQPKLVEQCASAGVAVAFVPELPNTGVCGATRWLTPYKALVQLSLRYKTNDHLWFTFFHEAGHIIKNHGKRGIIIETGNNSNENKELEANKFSADFLIPCAEYDVFISSGSFSESSIRNFADKIGIAPGIVVGRLQHDKKLQHSYLNHLKKRYDWV